ncbi:MAG: hypothetical protein AAF391_11270, partial [Bacteroidota bacterium]
MQHRSEKNNKTRKRKSSQITQRPSSRGWKEKTDFIHEISFLQGKIERLASRIKNFFKENVLNTLHAELTKVRDKLNQEQKWLEDELKHLRNGVEHMEDCMKQRDIAKGAMPLNYLMERDSGEPERNHCLNERNLEDMIKSLKTESVNPSQKEADAIEATETRQRSPSAKEVFDVSRLMNAPDKRQDKYRSQDHPFNDLDTKDITRRLFSKCPDRRGAEVPQMKKQKSTPNQMQGNRKVKEEESDQRSKLDYEEIKRPIELQNRTTESSGSLYFRGSSSSGVTKKGSPRRKKILRAADILDEEAQRSSGSTEEKETAFSEAEMYR